MSTALMLPAEQPAIRVVRFYKMDHLGDPVLLPNGRIRLGVEDCKRMLRSGIKAADLARRDNLIVAIGGRTAKDGCGTSSRGAASRSSVKMTSSAPSTARTGSRC